mmetsp:Transcript_14376/g.43127  ORF Transcript_14376/g.43127 Transcript_14376/m.43127 type:complete len:305 (+) Transcript_14376:2203-3117(+)
MAAAHGVEVLEPHAEAVRVDDLLAERHALREEAGAGVIAHVLCAHVEDDVVEAARRVQRVAPRLPVAAPLGLALQLAQRATVEAANQLPGRDREAPVKREHALDVQERALRRRRVPQDPLQLRAGGPRRALADAQRLRHEQVHVLGRAELVVRERLRQQRRVLRERLIAVPQQQRHAEVEPERRIRLGHHPVPQHEHLLEIDAARKERHAPWHGVQLGSQVVALERARDGRVVVLQEEAEDVDAHLQHAEVRVVVEPEAEGAHELLEERVDLLLHRRLAAAVLDAIHAGIGEGPVAAQAPQRLR